MFEVYKITSPSGKCYIGQTKRGHLLRFEEHKSAYQRWISNNRPVKGYQRKLFCAFDKYGFNNFTVELVSRYNTQADVDAAEISLITENNSIEDGYNLTAGGQGLRDLILSETHKNNISEARKKYFQTEEGIAWKETLSKRFSGDNNPGKNNIGKPSWNAGKKCPEHSAKLKGRTTVTDEGRKKMAENTKRRWEKGDFANRPKQPQEFYDKQAKEYEISTPEGESFIIKNLDKWCRENNMPNAAPNFRSSGKYKGYKAKRI